MGTSHIIKMITKLNRETKEGVTVWETDRRRPSSIGGNEELHGIVYTVTVLERQVRLYKFQYRSYYDEDNYSWIEDFRLEFVDSRGNSEWEFPEDSAIRDLYDSVQYKTSGIDDFFDKYLEDEPEIDEAKDSLGF